MLCSGSMLVVCFKYSRVDISIQTPGLSLLPTPAPGTINSPSEAMGLSLFHRPAQVRPKRVWVQPLHKYRTPKPVTHQSPKKARNGSGSGRAQPSCYKITTNSASTTTFIFLLGNSFNLLPIGDLTLEMMLHFFPFSDLGLLQIFIECQLCA